MRALHRLTKESGDAIRLTPPASARSLSRLRRLTTARWTAASDDERAVSSVTDGPWTPRKYDSRPDDTLKAVPVPLYGSIAAGRCITINSQ
jgi:hypothetical protein